MSVTSLPGSRVAAPERLGPEDVTSADTLWLRTIDDAIAGEERTISALQEHVSEIDETLTGIATLHEKIKYDIMVPYGRVAMFPGQMVHTNEVHVHLSSSITVHTSTKHAQSILQRRRDYAVDKQDLVQQQLDSLRSRRIFADADKLQDGERVQEIVEVYDEEMHGPLDAPMVSDQDHASRRYHGPPRNDSERAAEEAALESMRNFVSENEGDISETLVVPTDLHICPNDNSAEDSMSSHEADSDDEDSPSLESQPMSGSARSSRMHLAGLKHAPQLEQELDRLVAAFEGAADDSATSDSATKDQKLQAVHPLIQDVTNDSLPERQATSCARGASKEPTPSATGQERSKMTGLRHGFFNKNVKPKKGILKNTNVSNQAVPLEKVSGPRVSQSLAAKQGPSAADESAFSGFVRERSGQTSSRQPQADNHQMQDALTPSQGTKRVSKFKLQRAAAASSD